MLLRNSPAGNTRSTISYICSFCEGIISLLPAYAVFSSTQISYRQMEGRPRQSEVWAQDQLCLQLTIFIILLERFISSVPFPAIIVPSHCRVEFMNIFKKVPVPVCFRFIWTHVTMEKSFDSVSNWLYCKFLLVSFNKTKTEIASIGIY